jgi:SNF family Na+-dependent transporter
MRNIPPYPTFPTVCLIIAGISVLIIIMTLIVASFKTKKQKEMEKQNNTMTFTGVFILIAILGLFISIGGCGFFYKIKRRDWIYNYGSPAQQTGLAISDAFRALSPRYQRPTSGISIQI